MFSSWNILPNGSSNEFTQLLGGTPALNLHFQERFVTTPLQLRKKSLFIP